ncbi:hypothetical protein AeRB84_006863 [Aphanomyces euteiches]|nr:hypothetical protein AeRB84_006863 [Aphanomyces euteiches]
MKTAKEILVRNSFQTIASNIHALGKNKYFKAVVIGTLGIGKSNFLIYLLWTLLMERKKVIFLYHPDVIYFDGCGGVFMSNQRDMPQSNDSFWKDEDLWCLFDAKAKTEENLSSLLYSRMKIVVSPSAPRDIINDFQKPPQPSTYFIPLWTEAELEQIAPCFPAADNWKNRFLLLGGIPRIVLEDTTLEASKLLDIASICCDFSDCLKVVIWDSTLTRSSNVMHTLVHITSNEPFMTAEVCFASQAALDNIVHRNMIYAKRNMEQLLSSCKNHSLRAALCGRAFEIYAMEMLEKGGSFQSRQLVRGSCNSKPKETNLIIPSSTRTFADTMSSAHLPNRLYAPKTKSLCTIDAWIPQLGGFQMTINSNEAMRGDHEMYDSCGGKLFWLLPPTIYGSFSKEHPFSLDQYAVRIPYPNQKYGKLW